MALSNDIVLRPRFKIEIPQYNEVILSDFKNAKTMQSDFIVSVIDEHVFIKLPKAKQTYWSPQLHLEITAIDDHTSRIYGLFGPSPTVWTLFMFLHFLVAGTFIGFAIWAYSNWTLEQDYTIQFSIVLFMIILWIALYFAGSIGKASSIKEMHLLNDFMNEVLKKKSLNYRTN
ncbi:GTP-binding protein [Pseudotamlana carrageenivorans]|uniref:GTP-binding protein n=1 Tax=Pseudotamlana carrageenivorans TaxID=2069432 RepID=A0A2I7SEM7_9FLAO|nr:GTP-binding protein [Tamlana carrageenivorans]AUS04320.1 GTP-binding protein [Tamlana carrageenivorans]